jgi:hypothetical protein
VYDDDLTTTNAKGARVESIHATFIPSSRRGRTRVRPRVRFNQSVIVKKSGGGGE